MPECHKFEPAARRPFTVTPYRADAAGLMVASMPPRCSRHKAGDPPCNLWVDHHRARKTGPCFPLTVARCGPHGRAFTLYPPGQVPYGRVAIAPVSSDGLLLEDAPSGARTPGEVPIARPSFSDTVFGAAIDAAAGRAWPRKAPARPAHWRTQGRRLARGARLIGIAPTTADDEARRREQMARHLGVPTLVLVEQARRWTEARGYRERGAAIILVLAEMEASRRISDRLTCAGALAGLWGPPSRWHPGAGVLSRLPFS
jgi:hypothetical protein